MVEQKLDDSVENGYRERIILENANLKTYWVGLPVLAGDDGLLVVVQVGGKRSQLTRGMVV